MPTNRPTTVSHDTHAPPVDLAREAPFALGQLVVVPAELTLRTTGWSQRLEPRVMQVLVVLAHGAVVGRFRRSGVAPSLDGRLSAARVTGRAGREIVVLDAGGRPVYRSHPSARSVNPAAWSADRRGLIAPVLDGGGWRLFALDPTGRAAARPRRARLRGSARQRRRALRGARG